MQNNEAVDLLYTNHRETLLNITNGLMVDASYENQVDSTYQAEDFVSDLYLDLLTTDDFIQNSMTEDFDFDLGYIFFTLKSKLYQIIQDKYLVD